ncbi:hypothetical protein DN051_02820 [Streptomyces cadmiisoli]|uniref:Uncharacterized protein n=1 Tax=Streptomyces cadmiisoli TaxID=2184053 RepID=A0A2Z4IST1_9ACTN|nr:hypothetical protein DN051_02820 [Streptomyces cadmiisoli]
MEGDRRICAACGTAVRSYRFRFHPPESSLFERAVALAWCPGCRIYSGAMVHVPRTVVLADALTSLSPVQRERLLRKEAALIDFLNRQTSA